MVLKVWCLIASSVLTTTGLFKAEFEIWTAWDLVIILGFITLIITTIQTIYDYGNPKGWFD